MEALTLASSVCVASSVTAGRCRRRSRQLVLAGPCSPCAANSENLRSGVMLLRWWQAGARGLQGLSTSCRIERLGGYGATWCTRAVGTSAEGVKDHKYYEALTRGGEEVTEMLKEMVDLLKDISMNEEEEGVAVKMAAAAAVGQRLDKLDESFMLALDYMLERAQTDNDDRQKELLALMRETVLEQLSQKSPPQVQVVGLLCTTVKKAHRQDILRRSAGGGGTFPTESGGSIVIPGANLYEIAAQADDILATMEEKPRVPDRKLLAKLVIVREEARNMMGGGILDERNDNRGLKSLHESEVDFLSKLVQLQPGPKARERLSKVLRGKDEGADPETDDEAPPQQKLIQRPQPKSEKKKLPPVRPGMFVHTVTQVIGGMYNTNARGVTVQQLEWIHRESLDILQEIAFS